jgi:hypothetical protein
VKLNAAAVDVEKRVSAAAECETDVRRNEFECAPPAPDGIVCVFDSHTPMLAQHLYMYMYVRLAPEMYAKQQ